MPYIHNGRVVEKKPFTVKGLLLAIQSSLSLFVGTLFTTRPMAEVIEEHRNPSPQAANGGSGLVASLRGFLGRLGGGGGGQRVGNGGRGGDSGWAAAVNRRGGNVHTLPRPPISGGCGSS